MTDPPGPGWTGEPPTLTGDPLGAVGIVSADHEHAIAEIGYWVAPAARRRGAARRALQLLRDWCTGPGGFRRVELPIEVENAASCAVARAAAFTPAGILPERILHRGAPREIAMWSWSVDVTTDRD